MKRIENNVKTVKGFFDNNDWHYEMHDEENAAVFTGGIGGFDGIYSSYRFVLIVSDDLIQIYVPYPAKADERLAEMAEFVTRANYGLKYGAFEMDFNDGEVRFHFSVPDVAAREDTQNVLMLLLAGSTRTLDRYSKGFVSVLMGLESPLDAIAKCEAR